MRVNTIMNPVTILESRLPVLHLSYLTPRRMSFVGIILSIGLVWILTTAEAQVSVAPSTKPLAGTDVLAMEGDIASNLVAGVDQFLLRKLEQSRENHQRYWHRDFSSADAYSQSVSTNRQRLSQILGIRDPRAKAPAFELRSTLTRSSKIAASSRVEIHEVHWAAFGDVVAEGLLLLPVGLDPVADIIAIPDCEQTPEQLCGVEPGIPEESQFPRWLAERGCRVIIPALISRSSGPHLGRAKFSARELLYRSAFELGRHLVGYELQEVLAAADAFENPASISNSSRKPLGVIGYGEGGLLALYAGALDTRFQAVGVSGYFSDRRSLWQEPVDRNVFGLLEAFEDAEIASLIVPRQLLVEASKAPEKDLPGQNGSAPAKLTTPSLATVQAEVQRARLLVAGLNSSSPNPELFASDQGHGAFGSPAMLLSFLRHLSSTPVPQPPASTLARLQDPSSSIDRQQRLIRGFDQHSQKVLIQSPEVRREFMKNLKTDSLEAYERSAAPYRDFFYNEVIGRWDESLLPFHARSRQTYTSARWTGYEVVLDVFPDVIAYGVLCVPNAMSPGERRPVVVCQHGLEGRPQDVIMGNKDAYHDFAAALADRGFITFAPQNLYLFGDRFRSLQRKSNPLKKTLFSTIVPQHQQIVRWLSTLPFVDSSRIAFYGLSYGGKSAMRIPPLVPEYVLSICSADFNEWVGKNAATSGTLSRYSYAWNSEYEIFEFDLGSTFNYAEMAALIAPRPFMVERGHFDGVAPDESVAWEFAKVRFLYAAKLGIGDRCEMETFVGPHTIHGQGTYDFLHKHLKWPKP